MKKITFLVCMLIGVIGSTFSQTIYGCMDEAALNYNPQATEEPSTTGQPCIYPYEVSPIVLIFDYNTSETQNVSITGSGAWTMETDADWVNSRTTSGNGDATLALVAGVNPDSKPRTAIVYIKNGNYTLASFTVTQDAAPVYGCMDETALNYNPDATTEMNAAGGNPCIYAYEVSTEGLYFAYNASRNQTQDVTLTGTGVWEMQTSADWIYSANGTSGSGNGTLTLYPSQNPDQQQRTATVSLMNGNYTLASFTVTQDAAPVYGCMDETALNYNPDAEAQSQNTPCIYPYEVSQSTVNFPAYDGDGVTLDLTGTEYAWEAQTDAEWIEFDPAEMQLYIGVEDNSAAARQAIVYIKYGEYTLAEITVTQEAAPVLGCMDETALNYNPDATEESPNLPCIYPYEVSQETVNVPAAGTGEIDLTLTGSGYWEAQTDATEWLTLIPLDNTLRISANSNHTLEAREATVYIKNGEYTLASFTVTQEAGIAGCTDRAAVNYNPDATISDECIYPYRIEEAIDYRDLERHYRMEGLFAIAYAVGSGEFQLWIDDVEIATLTDNGTPIQYYIETNVTNNHPWLKLLFADRGLTANRNRHCVIRFDATKNTSLQERTATVTLKNGEYTLLTFELTQEAITRGCTDPASITYNPIANTSDGSCGANLQTITEPVTGCTDPESLTYNPIATVSAEDDCVYEATVEEPVCGCTDPGAVNYNVNATVYTEGSCYYADPENIFITAPEPETEVEGIIGTQPVEDCNLTAGWLIKGASILDVDLVEEGEGVNKEAVAYITWYINEMEIKARYELAKAMVNQEQETPGVWMAYFTIICNELKDHGYRSKGLRASEVSGLTTYTFAAPVIIDFKSGSTGIIEPKAEEQSEQAGITVHPNPTAGKVYLSAEGNIGIYNMQGTLMYEGYGSEADLSDYPQGIYLIKLDGRTVRVVKK